MSVLLPKDDYRTIHAAKILGVGNGDTIRAGIVMDLNNPHQPLAGLKTDAASVEWIPEGKVKKAEVLKNGDPPGSLLVKLGDKVNQGDLLLRLGIGERAKALAKSNPAEAANIARAVERLTAPEQMGTLFKALCAHSPGLQPAGF